MSDGLQITSPEIRSAFADYDREVTLHNIRIGCYLGMILMPAGVILDYFVYPDKFVAFFKLRLLCSALIGVFLGLVMTRLGTRFYRQLGVTLAMFPTFFIAWMIHASEGPNSPYYAGLNLVLLVVGFVLHWTYRESIIAVGLVLAMYLVACGLYVLQDNESSHAASLIGSVLTAKRADMGIFFNNLYFLVLTGVIVVTGNYFQSLLRFREFALRFELDKNQRMLLETNQKLVELDRVKNRFFANISHELRTPLTLLLSPLESIIAQQGAKFNAETRQTLGTMHANGMRLLKLINDLLDLVRVESGRMQIRREPVEVEDFVRGLANAVRKVAEDKRLRVEVSVEPETGVALLDRDKLEKILLNLLFNAIKFTSAGGRVELLVGKEGEELVLRVKDTGVGISPEQLPFVFDRFWQADTSSQRKYQGAGIGLALVKELAEVQGGTVTVESELERGTCMTVRLPCPATATAVSSGVTPESSRRPQALEESDPDPSSVAGESGGEEWLTGLYRRAELFPAMSPLSESIKPVEVVLNGGQPKVLIADDEPDMLRFLKSQLAAQWQVLEAVDGNQAVEKACQFLPDLILLDMMMPEKDGLEVCRELRGRTPTQHIPIVILTARVDEETKLSALSAGANDFLAKPFSTTELQVRVRNLLETHQSRQKLAKQKQILEATLDQLKDTEAELVQSEKLASLGRMSAGIIHEINNPLNYAKTNLFALRKKGGKLPESDKPEFEEILADIEDGIDRVRNIVSDLRTFTHPKSGRLEAVDVDHLVSMALRFLSNEWKDKITIERVVPEGLKVQANQNQIIQVLVNLLQNAADAIKSKDFSGETPLIRIEGREENGKTLIVVRDNGPGIDRETLPNIFDPFFTTKDVGEGMGLGLSICYRIMVGHGGRIHVRSEPGSYCEFALEFPGEM